MPSELNKHYSTVFETAYFHLSNSKTICEIKISFQKTQENNCASSTKKQLCNPQKVVLQKPTQSSSPGSGSTHREHSRTHSTAPCQISSAEIHLGYSQHQICTPLLTVINPIVVYNCFFAENSC